MEDLRKTFGDNFHTRLLMASKGVPKLLNGEWEKEARKKEGEMMILEEMETGEERSRLDQLRA